MIKVTGDVVSKVLAHYNVNGMSADVLTKALTDAKVLPAGMNYGTKEGNVYAFVNAGEIMGSLDNPGSQVISEWEPTAEEIVDEIELPVNDLHSLTDETPAEVVEEVVAKKKK